MTREEAAELYKAIGYFHLIKPDCEGCQYSQKMINRLQDKIKELTEEIKHVD